MIPRRFLTAINRVRSLEKYNRYLGAFVFGSVARGETTLDSDLDVKVIVDRPHYCEEISHPFIGGIKLDLSFLSFDQLTEQTSQEEKSGRIPMIAESVIIFDKKGRLKKLRESKAKLEPLKGENYKKYQFLIYHANDKVERNLIKDPATALLSMQVGINDLLKVHYLLSGKWWVSNKRILKDLDLWDMVLANLLRSFVKTGSAADKFKIWTLIIDHIVKPMGGRLKIQDNLCDCVDCKKDLARLLS